MQIDLPFKIKEFATFARQKPREELYNYDSNTHCAVGQFLLELGLETGFGEGQWSVSNNAIYQNTYQNSVRRHASFPQTLMEALVKSPHTWGALANRLGNLQKVE